MNFIFLCLFVLGWAQAQSNYGDNRSRADSDPKTLEARRFFNAHTQAQFKKSRHRYGLNHVSLKLNQRMVSQYGRGKDSANRIIPQENDQILSFISQVRSQPRAVFRELSQYPKLRKYKKEDIAKAIRILAGTKSINMSYWGYLDRSENLPDFDMKKGELNYNARWNEGKSLYLIYSPQEMKNNIMMGIIEQMNTKSWFQIFQNINVMDLCS